MSRFFALLVVVTAIAAAAAAPASADSLEFEYLQGSDVTLQELRIETFLPADAASEACLRRLITR